MWWVPSLFCVSFLISFFLQVNCSLQIVLSMWGKIMIPMYRLWLHGLYGLHGPRCPLSPKMPLNLLTHSPGATRQYAVTRDTDEPVLSHMQSPSYNELSGFRFIVNWSKIFLTNYLSTWVQRAGSSCSLKLFCVQTDVNSLRLSDAYMHQ